MNTESLREKHMLVSFISSFELKIKHVVIVGGRSECNLEAHAQSEAYPRVGSLCLTQTHIMEGKSNYQCK
jgi:hypothetical protein